MKAFVVLLMVLASALGVGAGHWFAHERTLASDAEACAAELRASANLTGEAPR